MGLLRKSVLLSLMVSKLISKQLNRYFWSRIGGERQDARSFSTASVFTTASVSPSMRYPASEASKEARWWRSTESHSN